MLLSGKRWILLFGMVACILLLAACGGATEETAKVEPALVEEIEGSEFNSVTLTEQAAGRLGIQSEPIREEDVDGTMMMVMPYSAVLYGLNGETWAYVRNPGADSRVFSREPVTVERIEGGIAILSAGPPVGTEVVTVGAAELFGADTGVGK
jgi:hypothetical protein